MAVTQSLTLTQVSQNVLNNTSKVRILWTTTQTGSSYNDTIKVGYYWVSINGGAETMYTVYSTLPLQSTKTIVDVTIDAVHNAIGDCTVAVRTSMNTNISAGVVTKSASLELDNIPRASTIFSAANVLLGSKCQVTWVPNATSFRYKLKFAMGNWSYTTGVIHPNSTSAYIYADYTIPLDVAHQIPNDRIGTMTVTLYTYSDSSGTKQVGAGDPKTFTITVPDNTSTKPTVSMSLSPVGSLPSAFAGRYIQGLTRVKATLSAEGKYGAGINSYSMKAEGVFYDSDDEYTSGYLTTPGIKKIYGYATDDRGHIGEKSWPITVVEYSNPKLEKVSAVRCDVNGNTSDSGTYLKITAKRSCSSVALNNVRQNYCKIMYRYSDGLSYSEWVTILDRTVVDRDEITTDPLLDGALSTQTSYTVQVRVIDDIGNYADGFIIIPTDKVYWHRDGKRNALGLGKYNERSNAIDSAWDFYMNGRKITGLPMPEGDTDAVPKAYAAPADVEMSKSLNAPGWYKIGVVSGEMCGVVTLTVGGVFVNNQASPSVVDIATQHNQARMFLRIPSLADGQISKIGVIKELTTVYGVYVYYNNTNTNTVKVNVHTHMGNFASEAWVASSVTDSNMFAVMTLKQ